MNPFGNREYRRSRPRDQRRQLDVDTAKSFLKGEECNHQELDRFSKDLGGNVRTSQIRQFYSKVLQLKRKLDSKGSMKREDLQRELLLLKAFANYQYGRKIAEQFYRVSATLLETVLDDDSEKRFQNFFTLLQLVVSHSKSGG